MIKGKNLILSIDGTPIAAAKSCSIELSRSFIAVAAPTDGKWSKSLPEKVSWSASADCLISTADSANTLTDALINGTELTIRFYDTDKGYNRTGKAFLSKVSLQGTIRNLAQFSVTLQGSGEITEYKNALTGNVDMQYNAYCLSVSDEGEVSSAAAANSEVIEYAYSVPKDSYVEITVSDVVKALIATNSVLEQYVDDCIDGETFNVSDINGCTYLYQGTYRMKVSGNFYVVASTTDVSKIYTNFKVYSL